MVMGDASMTAETELSRAIRETLALMPGVWITRCNTGKLQDIVGRWVTYGLGDGTPDLIGSVLCYGRLREEPADCCTFFSIGRWFAIEVKAPGNSPEPWQYAWGYALQRRGGYWGWADSVDAAVEHARRAADPIMMGCAIHPSMCGPKPPKRKRARRA